MAAFHYDSPAGELAGLRNPQLSSVSEQEGHIQRLHVS